MATDSKTTPPHPFDVDTVEHLIGLMAKHDLAEIALQDGAQRIRLRKSGATLSPVLSAPVHAPVPVSASSPAIAAPAVPPPPAKKLHEIKSEMVGTFYSRPKPDQADFAKPGSTIKNDSTICLIEAMKIFNEIKAEVSGTVVEMCVKNGDPVDFGTVLFRVDTAA